MIKKKIYIGTKIAQIDNNNYEIKKVKMKVKVCTWRVTVYVCRASEIKLNIFHYRVVCLYIYFITSDIIKYLLSF